MQTEITFSPAAERNKQPILEVLQHELPARGLVLEIASGSGQHIVHFARALPGLTWQPSERDHASLVAVRARMADCRLSNIASPVQLDVALAPWAVAKADAIVCINLTHIAPWDMTVALFRGGAGLLAAGAPLLLYGPFMRNGEHMSTGNEAFDQRLRQQDPRWGIRDAGAVSTLARGHGFRFEHEVEMPANNLTLIYRRE